VDSQKILSIFIDFKFRLGKIFFDGSQNKKKLGVALQAPPLATGLPSCACLGKIFLRVKRKKIESSFSGTPPPWLRVCPPRCVCKQRKSKLLLYFSVSPQKLQNRTGYELYHVGPNWQHDLHEYEFINSLLE